jgi:hypothetical protein
MTRIGLEAGPLSQWLYARMREAGLSVELLKWTPLSGPLGPGLRVEAASS